MHCLRVHLQSVSSLDAYTLLHYPSVMNFKYSEGLSKVRLLYDRYNIINIFTRLPKTETQPAQTDIRVELTRTPTSNSRLNA